MSAAAGGMNSMVQMPGGGKLRMGGRVAIMKEGSGSRQGPEHVSANAAACSALADIVAPTLGPKGDDVLLVVSGGNKDQTTITNDGATICDLLNIQHPATKLLVEISKSQDKNVGDGTTSVVILSSEAFTRLSALLCTQNTPNSVISVVKKCAQQCQKFVDELSIDITSDLENYMLKTASTALSSKLIAGDSEIFGKIAVDAIKMIGKKASLQSIGIKSEKGGTVSDTLLVDGLAIKKCFAYAGAKAQPYLFKNPAVALIKVELEMKAERMNAEVRVNSAEEYQKVIDAEYKIFFDKCEKIAASGAKVVLSSKPVGDIATQYFADRGIYCGGRVPQDDMDRAMKSLGGSVQTTLDNIAANLGYCESFEEIQVGNERYNIFKGGKKAKSCTVILRGSSEFYLAETQRSLHDALKVVQKTYEYPQVVAGGGAIEIAISTKLAQWANKQFSGKAIVYAEEIAKSFEIIPKTLAKNCGYDQLSILSQLKKLHNEGQHHYGVSVLRDEGLANNVESSVLEPTELTRNKLFAMFESILMLLTVDKTITSPNFSAVSQDLMTAKSMLNDRPN